MNPNDAIPDAALDPRAAVRLAVVALALGLAVDVLFRRQLVGISFPIWTALSIAALYFGARWTGLRFGPRNLALGVAAWVTSAGAALRQEPMTVALSVLCTWLLFALWIPNFRQLQLPRYGWLDIVYDAVSTPIQTVLRPWAPLADALRRVSGDRAARSRGFAVVRGLLLAIPVMVVLLGLLTSADLVFKDVVDQALRWLNLEWIRNLVSHSSFIAVGAVISLGALAAALRAAQPRSLLGEQDPLIPPFVGFIESVVVLSAVDLVFVVFVVIQFRYLFGGEANITQAGYTYADYARRGFGEMVMAALIGQGLILGLGQWARHDGRSQGRAFSALSAGMVAMLLVTLLSALTRLLLYEAAYGFTRSRTYAHIFIFWLGALLVALLALLVRGQLRRYAVACLVAGFGYAVTLAVLSPDGFIAARNLDRFELTGDLDIEYLSQLSPDAVPQLAGRAHAKSPPELLQLLACQEADLLEQQRRFSWPSINLGRQRALNALSGIQPLLEPFEVTPGSMELCAQPID